MPPAFKRLASVDVFRAVTMLLMLFVNDLDPVPHVPGWLKHAEQGEDRLGFADTIFPAFLFIVGLSIPLAIGQLKKKGLSSARVALHIFSRSLALLVMGFFHVNLENYNEEAALLPEAVWEILITVGFFLVWLAYPPSVTRMRRRMLQLSGIVLLLCMAVLFRGGDDVLHPAGMQPYWWGILGLIGWAYLICAGVFLLAGGRLAVLVTATLFFFLFNLGEQTGWLESIDPVSDYIWIAGSGAMPAFTMTGVVFMCVYQRLAAIQHRLLWPVLLLGGLVLLVYGFAVRPYGGINKPTNTPAWVGICTGISVWAWALFIWLVDIRQKQHWFRAILPAGTSTLTCYLLPYLLYAGGQLLHFRYPLFLDEGAGGLLRSLLLAFLLVRFTGWLEKKQVRMKI